MFYYNYPKAQRSNANKWVFMFDSVSTLVLMCAWQYGHVKDCDSEPNCVFPTTMISAKLLFN